MVKGRTPQRGNVTVNLLTFVSPYHQLHIFDSTLKVERIMLVVSAMLEETSEQPRGSICRLKTVACYWHYAFNSTLTILGISSMVEHSAYI